MRPLGSTSGYCGGLLPIAMTLAAATAPLGVDVRVDFPLTGEEEELRAMLAAQDPGSPPEELERLLLATGRYRSVVCKRPEGPRPVICSLATTRRLRRLRIDGVPGWVLEEDLQKRIFLRPGQILKASDQDSRPILERQRQRLLDFLEREGIFGSSVDLLALPVSGQPRLFDLLVKIEGGHPLQVRRVEVEGAGPVAPATMIARVHPSPYQIFSPLALREEVEDLERLHREKRGHPETQISGRYKADLEASAVDIVLRVRTGPYLDLRIEGDVGSDQEGLLSQLTFAQAGSIDETEVENGRRAMENWLQERGYLRAAVAAERTEPDERQVVVRYTIRRGPRYRIVGVDVMVPSGLARRPLFESVDLGSVASVPGALRVAPEFTLQLLPSALVPEPFSRWLELLAWGRGASDVVEQDRRALEEAIAALGYPEGVVTANLELVDDRELRVRFRMNTGAEFRLKKISCAGHHTLTCADLRSVLRHRVGGPFMMDAFETERARLLGLFIERGYPYADVQVLADFDESGAPTLHLQVEEGVHAHLGSVLVNGNLDTRREVIAREIGVEVGEPLDPLAIGTGTMRLRRTGLFRRVNTRYLGLEEQRDQLTLVLDLEERKTLSLDTAVNFSTAELLGLEAELRERNGLGRMIDLRAEGRLGLYVGRHTFLRGNATWPRIWGGALSLTLSAGYDLTERPIERASFFENLYFDAKVRQTQTVASRALLELAVTDALSFATMLEYGIDWERDGERVGVGSPFPGGEPRPTESVTWQLRYRRLDNPFDPRRGVQLRQSLRLGSHWPPASEHFIVGSAGMQAYRSWQRLTFALSLRGTYGRAFTGAGEVAAKATIPERDRIIAGGDHGVRGYEETDFSIAVEARPGAPLPDLPGVQQPSLPHIMYEPGLYGAVVNLELRTLVVRDLWIGDLQWAVFLDMGYVADQSPGGNDWLAGFAEQWAARQLGFGLGTGIRYVTPVGPLVLDWAFDPTRPSPGRLHFRFGYSF